MKVNYDGLWKKLIDNKMKKKDLIEQVGISSNIVAKMGKEESVSLETIAKLCDFFSCCIDDWISFNVGGDENVRLK